MESESNIPRIYRTNYEGVIGHVKTAGYCINSPGIRANTSNKKCITRVRCFVSKTNQACRSIDGKCTLGSSGLIPP